MRADFFRVDDPHTVVGSARWTGGPGGSPLVTAESAEVRDALERVFRPAPLATPDSSLRPAGAAGTVVLQPGSLQWFQAAARLRGQPAGLCVRFVDEEHGAMGWDPAGAYRPFPDAMERKVRMRGPQPSPR